MARVVHAHHATGIGEFEHHVGHQVALRQQARAGGVVDVGADLAGNPARQRLNAVGFVAQGAQLLLEQHGFRARQVIFRAFLTVGVEEELGVGRAWTHHLLVTGDDLLRVFRLDVGHEDKVRQQFARGVIHREILLVALHGVHQRFRRHRREFLFEFGSQYHRPFHQRGHFFQQAVAQIGLAANLLRRQLCIALDEGFTRFIVGDHFAALQQDLRVLVGVVEGELGFAHEAVARTVRAESMPSTVHGIRSAPSSIVTVCTGRTNCTSESPQRISFGIGSLASAVLTMPASSCCADWPLTWARYINHSPLSVTGRSA